MSEQEQIPRYDPYTGRPLVPPAEREFIPSHEVDAVHETVWFNPTDKDAVLPLYVGVTPCRSQAAKRQFRAMNPQQQKEFRTGIRIFTIRKGTRRSISSDFDLGIQQYECMESECANNKLYCRDRTHHKIVTGGLGPQLVNESMQHRPLVHPSLNEAAALEKMSREAAERFLRERDVATASMSLAFSQAEQARAEQARRESVEAEARAKADAERAATPPQPAQSQGNKKKD